MTGQAIVGYPLLPVASHTASHADFDRLTRHGFFPFGHVPMTSGAIQFGQLHMTAMRKINMIRHSVDLDPRQGLVFRGIGSNERGLGVIVFSVAIKTGSDIGQARVSFFLSDTRMALAAFQPQLNMLLMVIGDGLTDFFKTAREEKRNY